MDQAKLHIVTEAELPVRHRQSPVRDEVIELVNATKTLKPGQHLTYKMAGKTHFKFMTLLREMLDPKSFEVYRVKHDAVIKNLTGLKAPVPVKK